MKQQDIVNAYKVIQKYENEKLPLDISYGFFKLKKLLQSQWDFEIEREKAIFEKYDPQQEDNGNFVFKSKEDQQSFAQEIAELLSMECDWDEDKVKIDFRDRLDMPVVDIEALDNFITF